jgi:hypothetical protein
MSPALPAAPCDVLAVWSSDSFAGTMIRAGEALTGKPAVANHVAIVTHVDQMGRWLGIQGRPGGVGPVDLSQWLASPRTRTNHDQPKGNSEDQARFLASAAKSLGISYDWVGIAQDTLDALHLADLSAAIDPLWRWGGTGAALPGHVVCSSLAAALYAQAGWAHPAGADRRCEPADWWDWGDRKLWEAKAK